MIELVQGIAGFFEMVMQSSIAMFEAGHRFVPFFTDIVSYVPSVFILPCIIVLNFALIRFVLSII